MPADFLFGKSRPLPPLTELEKLRGRQRYFDGLSQGLCVALILVFGAQIWLSWRQTGEDSMRAGAPANLPTLGERLATQAKVELKGFPIETLAGSEAWARHVEKLGKYGARLAQLEQRDRMTTLGLSLQALGIVFTYLASLGVSFHYRKRAHETAREEAAQRVG